MLLQNYLFTCKQKSIQFQFHFLFSKDLKKPFDKAWKDYETKL